MSRLGKTGHRPTVKHVTLMGVTFEVEAAPFCDCPRPAGGFIKRDDEVWVRPCCMRVTETRWIRHGDHPFSNPKGCAACMVDVKKEFTRVNREEAS